MGNIFSRFRLKRSDRDGSSIIEQIYGPAICCRKRKASHDELNTGLETKRFKLNTLEYLYQKLFIDGLNSDVQVHALGHTWRLHRLYLEQCGYFRALFQGNWSDSGNNEYNLNIEDENICYTGLNNVLASLYNNEIEIDEKYIAGVCGAASMLNLTSVLEKCNIQLANYLCDKERLLICLRLADCYGFKERMKEALNFLRFMFCQYCTDEAFLRGLQQSWLIALFSEQFVCMRDNEMDLYTALKNWIFLTEFPDSHLGDENAQIKFFKSSNFDWRRYFALLRLIRVGHLISLQSSLDLITSDGIVPSSLIKAVIYDQWRMLLRSEESTTGFNEAIDDAEFYASCYRFGRVGIDAYSRLSWRWLGYIFGMDLVVSYDYGFVRVTRNCVVTPNQHQVSVKHVDLIKFNYRFIVCSEQGRTLLDTLRQTKFLNLDRGFDVGSFKLPPKGDLLSVHLFCLPFAPIQQPAHYWEELLSSEQQIMTDIPGSSE